MTQDEVRGRIQAFVADFHTRWQRSGKSPGMFAFDPGVFDVWANELAGLAATHCTPAQLELDVPGLFTAGRVAATQGGPAPIDVLDLGRLTCASGVLTVLDFGSLDSHFVPLARRVVPGTYAVELAKAAEVTVALRLLRSPRRRRPAGTPPSSPTGHAV